jgi:hypothetical protein
MYAMGVGENIYVNNKNPTKRLHDFLCSKLVNYIDISMRTGHNISTVFFTLIPNVNNIPESELPVITDTALYKYFGITSDEINLIEKFI